MSVNYEAFKTLVTRATDVLIEDIQRNTGDKVSDDQMMSLIMAYIFTAGLLTASSTKNKESFIKMTAALTDATPALFLDAYNEYLKSQEI